MLKSARKGSKDPEGRMPLVEHLRELRNRLAKALAAVVVVTVVAAFFYNEIIEVFTRPIFQSVGCSSSFAELAQQKPGTICARITINGLLAPFTLALKVSLVVGVALASPVWLYQLWAFLAPGLHRHEKRYARSFVAAGFPLFLCGGVVAYKTLPTTARVLIDFTPSGVENLLPLDDLLDLVTRLVVVFGLAFELPLLLVLLNFGGVLPAARMRGWWRAMILGITLFAAIATPSTDPLTMIILAAPIWVLYAAATMVATVHDRRKAAREAMGPADDEASELDDEAAPLEAPGPMDELPAGRRETRASELDDAT